MTESNFVPARVKSALNSKINWTQIIGALAMLLAMFGIDMPADTQASVVALIAAAQAIVTWVLRTWFTTALTKASVARKTLVG